MTISSNLNEQLLTFYPYFSHFALKMRPAPRNSYDGDVDFSVLALQDADFRTHLKSNNQLDFSDPAAVKCCAQRERWRFVATDIDEKNLSYARQNILANNLKSRIRPLLTDPNDPLIPLDALGLDRITFTICNPPFYSSATDLLSSASAKSRPPHSACTGSPIEMVTLGGEVAFVTRMITESQHLQERCQWYTSMLGKYSSLGLIVEELKERGVGNWAVKEFVQGEKTRRWGVGWSWGRRRPREDVARGVSGSIPKHLLPFPSEFNFEIPTTSVDLVGSKISALLEGLDLRWRYRSQISTGVGFAKANVWSRAARRQRKREAVGGGELIEKSDDDDGNDDDDDDDDDEGIEEATLGFKIQLARGSEVVAVSIRWLQGVDCVLFESFCGMVKRQMAI
ncbi:MAG: hypothetical protein LQ339_003566 [Xanthoria mediterranea]|nr:MAG: hypothetical protein LQ339_003566 [Xanthoria mediterranea]